MPRVAVVLAVSPTDPKVVFFGHHNGIM